MYLGLALCAFFASLVVMGIAGYSYGRLGPLSVHLLSGVVGTVCFARLLKQYYRAPLNEKSGAILKVGLCLCGPIIWAIIVKELVELKKVLRDK